MSNLRNILAAVGIQNSQGSASQAGAQQSQMSQQQLAAQQQWAGQMQAINNQIGTVTLSNGTQSQIIVGSTHCPQGTAYLLPNGTLVAHPSNISQDQMDESKRIYLQQKKDQFLRHSEHFREAFINDLRAKAVADDMNGPGLFGVQRTGYVATTYGGLTSYLPQQVEITLNMYEDWHAESLLDKILEE